MIGNMIIKSNLRLSKTEKENAIKEERRKLLIFRKQQVNQQANERSAKIRERCKKQEDCIKNKLRNNITKQYETDKEAKLILLKAKYDENLASLGKAHQNAEREIEYSKKISRQQIQKSKTANERGVKALKLLHDNKENQLEKENKFIQHRLQVKNKEKERSNKMAKLPIPATLKPPTKVEIVVPKKVQFYEAGTFTTSSYVPKNITVLRETSNNQTSAHEMAQNICEDELRLKEIKQRRDEEETKKREERGASALRTQKLKQLREQTIAELDKADEEHELSQYFKGGYQVPLESCTHPTERCAEIEVEKILIEESQALDLCQQGTSSYLSSVESTDGSTSSSGSTEDEYDQELNLNCPPEPSNSEGIKVRCECPKNIVFKETVPIHELRNISDKFTRAPPHSYQSSDDEESVSEDRDFLDSSPDTEYLSLECNRRLFERLKPFKNLENAQERLYERFTQDDSLSSSSSDHADIKKSLQKRLEQLQSDKDTFTSSSTASTVYKHLPHYSPPESDPIYSSLRKIQANNENISKLIENKKKSCKNSEKTAFKTPPRFYSEEIKSDGSGQRPISRRQKDENFKKALMEIYMKKIMKSKFYDSPRDFSDNSSSYIEMNTEDGSRLLKLESSSTSREFSSQSCSTSQELNTYSQEPTITSQEPTTTSLEPTTTFEESSTTSQEPTTTFEESSTTSQEPTTTFEESSTTTIQKFHPSTTTQESSTKISYTSTNNPSISPIYAPSNYCPDSRPRELKSSQMYHSLGSQDTLKKLLQEVASASTYNQSSDIISFFEESTERSDASCSKAYYSTSSCDNQRSCTSETLFVCRRDSKLKIVESDSKYLRPRESPLETGSSSSCSRNAIRVIADSSSSPGSMPDFDALVKKMMCPKSNWAEAMINKMDQVDYNSTSD